MNNFWDVIESRRSVRKFARDTVSNEMVEKCIAAAHNAPSGGNQKNWRFIVVESREKMDELQRIVEDKIYSVLADLKSAKARREFEIYSLKYFTFFADAPILICVILKPYDSLMERLLKKINPDLDYQTSAGVQSVAAAVENLLLAAASLGLGSCWMTGPLIAKDKLEKSLKIEEPESLFAMVPIGYPSEEVKKHPLRETVDDIVEWI